MSRYSRYSRLVTNAICTRSVGGHRGESRRSKKRLHKSATKRNEERQCDLVSQILYDFVALTHGGMVYKSRAAANFCGFKSVQRSLGELISIRNDEIEWIL